MKIDIFAHILPERYLAALREKVKPVELPRDTTGNRVNCEIDMRVRLMDRYPDMLQVLTVSLPPLETLVKPNDAAELARIANDELAELVAKYPDKFIAAVACLPLNDIDAALEETDRAITQLRLRGVQIFTNINGEPLDLPKFRPLYEKMTNYDLPIWIHPRMYQPSEPFFGFFIETASAMLRLVSAGIFNDYPDIKFITHHCGSMIPFFERRIRWWLPLVLGEGHAVRNPVEHFRRFYADTAVFGGTSALRCGYDFFGADHLLFGTDMPLGVPFGLTRETIHSVEKMGIPATDQEKIFEQNAVRLLRLAI